MNRRALPHGVRLAALVSTLMLLVAACSSTPTTFTLSVAVDGTGAGSVTSDPVGIDTSTPGDGQADFSEGTAVTLTAVAQAGSAFTSWSGACAGAAGSTCDVTMDAAKNVTATIDLLPGTVYFSQDGNGNGLYELNMETGEATLVGTGISGVTSSTVGLAGRGATEPLVGSTYTTLVDIEQDGSGATQFSSVRAEGLTYVASSDLVYAIINSDFRSVSPTTGVIVEDLTDPINDLEGLAADESIGIIYAVGNDTNLWAYDIAADSWSIVFDTTINWFLGGLAFNEVDGLLYAISADTVASDALYRIDPVAGTVTEIGSTGLSPANGGLAWVPAP